MAREWNSGAKCDAKQIEYFIIVKINDRLFNIENKPRNRHYEFGHDQDSIDAYQHVLLRHYRLDD